MSASVSTLNSVEAQSKLTFKRLTFLNGLSHLIYLTRFASWVCNLEDVIFISGSVTEEQVQREIFNYCREKSKYDLRG